MTTELTNTQHATPVTQAPTLFDQPTFSSYVATVEARSQARRAAIRDERCRFLERAIAKLEPYLTHAEALGDDAIHEELHGHLAAFRTELQGLQAEATASAPVSDPVPAPTTAVGCTHAGCGGDGTDSCHR